MDFAVAVLAGVFDLLRWPAPTAIKQHPARSDARGIALAGSGDTAERLDGRFCVGSCQRLQVGRQFLSRCWVRHLLRGTVPSLFQVTDARF